MDFLLFLLVNAVLFIRPSELAPDLEGLPIYNIVIVLNLLIAAPAIINYLIRHGVTRCPATFCVFGVFAGVVLSHASHFDFWYARMCGLEFSKIVAYFLILVATINSSRRLFTFLAAIVAFTLVLVTLSVLQYHGIIDIPALSVIMGHDYDELTGETFAIPRMRATGIFNDPNDVSMIIVAAIVICTYGFFSRQLGVLRFALAVPIGFLVYAITLTQSRGGLLALIIGGSVLLYLRLGMWKGGALIAAVVPAALIGMGGRQTDFASSFAGGTAETRVELWSEGLQLLKSAPVFGIGQGFFADHAGQVAHNSFVHAFTELGMVGGMMFLGLFALAGWSLWRLRAVCHEIPPSALRSLLPYLLALLAAYVTSMLSLSRSYVVPTYMIAGLAAVYDRLVTPQTSLAPLRINSRTLAWLAVASVGFIAAIYLYIRVFFRFV